MSRSTETPSRRPPEPPAGVETRFGLYNPETLAAVNALLRDRGIFVKRLGSYPHFGDQSYIYLLDAKTKQPLKATKRKGAR